MTFCRGVCRRWLRLRRIRGYKTLFGGSRDVSSHSCWFVTDCASAIRQYSVLSDDGKGKAESVEISWVFGIEGGQAAAHRTFHPQVAFGR